MRRPGRCDQATEEGVTVVLVALTMTALLIMVAFVLDLGFARGGARLDQKAADLAALAGGKKLSSGDPVGACQDIIKYLNENADRMPAISGSSFCNQAGQAMNATTCSPGGTLAQAAPVATAGAYTVSVHYPVPNSEIADAKFGAGINDGVPCDRMRVILTSREPSFFGRIAGSSGYTVTRSATVKTGTDQTKLAPALWLLDPTHCVALDVSGGAKVTVGTATTRGIISIDSDGSDCPTNSMQSTISASGSGTRLEAIPLTGTTKGLINLFAMATGATSCSTPACVAADVDNGRLAPQPVPSGERATRAPVDYKWNCKTGYPTFHGVVIPNCPAAGTTPKYIDLLSANVGNSGQPAGYQRWTSSYSCNVPTGITVVTGNWWIDCPSGLTIGNNVDLTFQSGNLVLDGGLKMTAGTLNVNTANPTATLTSACKPPTVTTPCLASSSAEAGLFYSRAGDFDLTGGVLKMNRTMVFTKGYVKVNGAAPIWTAPTEGPFKGLSLWSEAASNKFSIAGGTGMSLSGTFFTPEAEPMSLTGNGDWGQQNAQFISYDLAISGGFILKMAPDADNVVTLPPKAGSLIR